VICIRVLPAYFNNTVKLKQSTKLPTIIAVSPTLLRRKTGGFEIPHGMTMTNIEQLATRLAVKLNIDTVKVIDALKAMVREDVLKIAKNEPGGKS